MAQRLFVGVVEPHQVLGQPCGCAGGLDEVAVEVDYVRLKQAAIRMVRELDFPDDEVGPNVQMSWALRNALEWLGTRADV